MSRITFFMLGMLCAVAGPGLTGCRTASPRLAKWANNNETRLYFDHYTAAPGTSEVKPTADPVRIITVSNEPAFAGLLRAAERHVRSLGGTVATISEGGNGTLPLHPKRVIRRLAHQQGANLAVVYKQYAGAGIYEHRGPSAFARVAGLFTMDLRPPVSPERQTSAYTVTDHINGVRTRDVHVSDSGQGPFVWYVVHVTLFRGDPADVAALDPKQAVNEPNNPERTVWGEAMKLSMSTAIFPLSRAPVIHQWRYPDTDKSPVKGRNAFASIRIDGNKPPPECLETLKELGRLYGASSINLTQRDPGFEGMLGLKGEPGYWQATFVRKPVNAPKPHG